jgi:hypothetical protein
MPAQPESSDPRDLELKAVLADADPLIRNILASLDSGNYRQYIRDFDKGSKDIPTEAGFRELEATIKKNMGRYEEGMCQVHKIEMFSGSYAILYFVKFQKLESSSPCVCTMQVRKDGGRLVITAVSFKEYHAPS